MYFRRATVAVVSGLVGYGAWYTYNVNSASSPQDLSRPYTSVIPDDATPTRSVLIISADDLQTGTFVGEGPISKTTENNGETVVEMLTPGQSTQKLRKMEESYFVNRGRGVLRYDLVQLPSNNPIEDDHAEKIVEVPSRAEAQFGSDWCFWGVFDGHSYVSYFAPASVTCALMISIKWLDDICQASANPHQLRRSRTQRDLQSRRQRPHVRSHRLCHKKRIYAPR